MDKTFSEHDTAQRPWSPNLLFHPAVLLRASPPWELRGLHRGVGTVCRASGPRDGHVWNGPTGSGILFLQLAQGCQAGCRHWDSLYGMVQRESCRVLHEKYISKVWYLSLTLLISKTKGNLVAKSAMTTRKESPRGKCYLSNLLLCWPFFSEESIRVQVDRYIGWPGQALSYTMGAKVIKDTR